MAFGMPANPNNYASMGQNATDADYARSQELYGFDNPETAMDSVLRDRGINPYAANPFLQTMRSRASRPLAQAYLMNRAQGGGPQGGSSGVGSQGGTTAGTTPFDYADYLNKAMQGDTGGIYASIRSAAGSVPTAIQQVRDYQKAQFAGQQPGGTIPAVNPFMEALGAQFGADSGQGAAQAQAALYSPLMAQPLSQAYRTGVNQASSNALYQMMSQPNPSLNDDLWKWLYGI